MNSRTGLPLVLGVEWCQEVNSDQTMSASVLTSLWASGVPQKTPAFCTEPYCRSLLTHHFSHLSARGLNGVRCQGPCG